MLEGSMAVVKPEMKSYIWVQTADGSVQQVEEEVAMFCPMICREVLHNGIGSCKTNAITLPQRVNSAIFGLILNYCQFHQVPGRSNKERKTFDEKFVRLDTKNLCELASAADSLQLRPLVDITCRALARMIEGRTPEEIRETFNIPDDLTEEEKLEPLKNITDDPHIRLLNRLYARKRKELRERHQLKNVEVEEERVDKRSVDDLLSYINGVNGDTKGTGGTKNKKKNRRKKDQHRKLSSTDESENSEKNNTVANAATPNKTSGLEDNITCSACQNDLVHDMPTSLKTSKLEDKTSAIFATDLDFDDDDIDDELDPAVKEELDREVEDFARRLNSVWPERMQEILSFGQERKLAPIYVNGTGSLNRYTGSKQ